MSASSEAEWVVTIEQLGARLRFGAAELPEVLRDLLRMSWEFVKAKEAAGKRKKRVIRKRIGN